MFVFTESDTFRAFFAISQERIDADLEQAQESSDTLRQEERDHLNLHPSLISAESLAFSYHRRLLQGCVSLEQSRLPRDLLIYSLTLPAHQIAELACTVACRSGRLAELSVEMKKLSEGEGLGGDSIWSIGEGPAAYQEASAESDQILDDISETIFIQVLRRYHCHEIIELIEKKRDEYEVRYEVGRRLVHPDLAENTEANRFEEQLILERYGELTHRRLQSRLRKVGL